MTLGPDLSHNNDGWRTVADKAFRSQRVGRYLYSTIVPIQLYCTHPCAPYYCVQFQYRRIVYTHNIIIYNDVRWWLRPDVRKTLPSYDIVYSRIDIRILYSVTDASIVIRSSYNIINTVSESIQYAYPVCRSSIREPILMATCYFCPNVYGIHIGI